MDTKCSQIDSGAGASHLTFDMSAVLNPGVILRKQAKDSLVSNTTQTTYLAH